MEAAMRSMRTAEHGPNMTGTAERPVTLEMTFWRIEPLDELVDFAHRCVGKLHGVVPPPAQCSLKVYGVPRNGGRHFEVQLNLVALSTCAESVCYRGPDLFGTVEQAFEALLHNVCERAEATGVRARAYPIEPTVQDGGDGRLAPTGT